LSIRNIAICKIEKDDHIFVLEGYDPKKDETFYRPIGGGIEFGELAKEAAVREFQEELNTNIVVGGNFQVFENIFEFNGKPGHEVVFILDATFEDSTFYEHREFVGNEGSNTFKALWMHIDEFTSGRKILYPEGFVSSLEKSNKTL
jgi:8-oxo-dGTP pyrophosphatase MutT (NUDIX family)